MSPAKRLKVRGIRTVGLTSIRTPLAVCMYICSFPALLTGESSRVRRHYTTDVSMFRRNCDEGPHSVYEPDVLCQVWRR